MKYLLYKNASRKKTEQGYILLLSLLVTSIILAVGFGIYNITLREVVLSSFLRDSEKALAAADRGVECVLYWDRMPTAANPILGITYGIFATSSSYQDPPNFNNAVCNNGAGDKALHTLGVTNWSRTWDATSATTTFSINFSDGTCADVLVAKVGNISTSVIGDGYNTPGTASNVCTSTFLRRTQREIAVFTNF